jgi:IclR family pca regulon transcriptional regulator
LDDTEIVHVARVPAQRSMALTLTIGSRLPAYPTSMGRVLLAGLPPDKFEDCMERARFQELMARTETDPERFRAIIDQVRAQGYALVDEEREIGVRSAAAPLKGRGSQVLAAINVSVSAARVSKRHLAQEIVPKLVAAAEEISSDLSHLSSPELDGHAPS